MDDLISRQALMKEFSDFVRASNSSDFAQTPTWNDAVSLVGSMPSAQPELNKGKWIPHRLISREYIGTVLVSVDYDYWFCDTCGYRVENGQPMYNYCPNCGAEMRGEQDE